MRKLILLLLLPIGLFAQDKGSSKIFIKNELSAKDNYTLIVKSLMDNDYFIETKDLETLYIKTQPKPVNKNMGLYYLNIRSLDKQIQISGLFKTGIEINFGGVNSTDNYGPIILKGGFYKVAFENMNNFALKIEGDKTYN